MRIHILSAILLMSLSACSRQAPEAPMPPTSSSGSAPALPAPTTAFKGEKGMLGGNAETAPSCSTPAVMTITWDVTGKVATESVKLYVGDETDAKLFAAGGAQGSGKTGPWTIPGSVFVLRNGQDEAELDRMIIPGAACP